MSQQAPTTQHHRRLTRLGATFAALLCLGLLGASSASAAFEQVGNFAGTPGVLKNGSKVGRGEESWAEEVQFGNVGGMAVNYTGAGGVPAGTIYAAAAGRGQGLVARYNPDGSFSERWTFAGNPVPNERCGPEGDPSYPRCELGGTGQPGNADVDVNQSTGDVYVYDGETAKTGVNLIHVYSPDGSKLITEFAEITNFNESLTESPGKLHSSAFSAGAIAVDGAGNVYIADRGGAANYHRLMEFKPSSPGDFEHYVYAGQSHDLMAGAGGEVPQRPVFDATGDLYIANEEGYIAKLDPSQPGAAPLCDFKFSAGNTKAVTVDPKNGEVFFTSRSDNSHVHRLEPCQEGKFLEAGAISFSPKREEIGGLAFDPQRKFSADRPAGVLYAGAATGAAGNFVVKENEGKPESFEESSLGYIFSQSRETPPTSGAESFIHVTATTADLGAQVDPEASTTNYTFQYLPESAYEANEPDEEQSLSVSATGGLFALGFEGEYLGGAALANISSGSKTVTGLKTATATGTLKAASGSGNLNGAEGKGTTIKGSQTISSAVSTKGSFELGQGIAGKGIPAGATIMKIKVEGESGAKELTISAATTESAVHVALTSGTDRITSLNTTEGTFEVGQLIAGESIEPGTAITKVGPAELTLSKPVNRPESGTSLKAGSTKVTSLVQGAGSFTVGQPIEGEGIPAESKVTAVGPGELTLSNPATKSGASVAFSSPGPAPLAVGEQVEGPGISAGTRINSIKAGQMTLSAPATVSAEGVPLHAGISAIASAQQVRVALEGLAGISKGGVRVNGGPGDETGSSPYRVTFTGKHENLDVPELEIENLTLTGGSSSATVQTEHDGGGGFSSGALESPAGGAVVGEGNEPVAVTAPLVGLEPGTTYHFRSVATSHCSVENPEKVCEGTGETLSFRTFPVEASVLPDRRAYELVSPPDKQGGEVIPADPWIASCPDLLCKPGTIYTHFPLQSAPSGNAVVYEGTPFDSESSALHENEYMARRDPNSGWHTVNLTPTQIGTGGGQGYLAFTADLSQGVLRQQVSRLTPDAPAEYEDFYTQRIGDPSVYTSFFGESQVFHRPTTGGNAAFRLQYAGASVDLSRIFFAANDALTEATTFAPAAVDGGSEKLNLYEWHEGQLSLVNVLPGNTTTQPGASFAVPSTHPISKDGTRAFFSDESGQVYVREGGEYTREITAEGFADPGKFVTAATDGSKVLLANGHLHLLDEEGEPTIDLTRGKGGFQGVVGESEDLSHIYFVDTEVLDETPNQEDEEAREGEFNLYAWVQGEGTRYVARLSQSDNLVESFGGYRATDWSEPYQRTAEASPHGRYLAFLSQESLTGYDNTGPSCHVISVGNHIFSPGPCQEAFVYDSATGKLACASCNPSGERPLSFSVLRRIHESPNLPLPHYLSDEGRLLFDSRDSLLPADVNNGVEDVYEWEPKGVGSCEAEFAEGGCVSLVSAGTGTVDSNLLMMDEGGANVLFTTRDQLALKDKDELIDLYDARVEGGIGAETEVARTECQGEACQAQTSAPNDPTPGSSTFEGAGNVKEEAKAKKHAKKHKKKRHAKKHSNKRAAKSNRGGAK